MWVINNFDFQMERFRLECYYSYLSFLYYAFAYEASNSSSTSSMEFFADRYMPCEKNLGFGGSNIDATAWEDKKCKDESRFPAQVRIRVRKICKALEEDSFRPVLHHYDGPKFRLELSVPEAVTVMDGFCCHKLCS